MGWFDFLKRAGPAPRARYGYTLQVIVRPGESVAQALAPSGDLYDPSSLVVVGDDVRLDDVMALETVRRRAALGGFEVTCLSTAEFAERGAAEEARAHRRSDVQETAYQAARQRVDEDAPPHPDESKLIAPPLHARELPPAGFRARPLEGVLRDLVGPAVGTKELSWGDEQLPPDLARRVRAWALPPLIGQPLVARSVHTLGGALRALLQRQLGALPFRVDSSGFGGPGKYLHVHASAIAPPDGATPMAIELYANILGAGDVDFSTLEGGRLLQGRRSLDPRTRISGEDLPRPLYLCVAAATYANVLLPGVGVPFYE